MIKNFLFFLSLAISINVLAMENQSVEPEKKDHLKEVINQIEQFYALLNGFNFDILREAIQEANKDKGDAKNGRIENLANNFAELSQKFANTLKPIDAKKPILPLIDLVGAELDNSNEAVVFIRTKTQEFRCLEKALLKSKKFEEIIELRKKEITSSETTIEIEVENGSYEKTAFPMMLYMLHNKVPGEKPSPFEFFEFLFLSKEYGCDEKAIQSFVTMTDFIFTGEEIASLNTKKNYSDIVFFKNHLAYLPSWAVEHFLKNPFFRTDSENSIFYLLVLWAEKQAEQYSVLWAEKQVEQDAGLLAKEQAKLYFKSRLNIIEPMLQYVRWKDISLEYLVTVIKNIVNEYNSPLFDKYYELAVNMKLVEFEKDQKKTNENEIAEFKKNIKEQAAHLKYSVDLQSHKKALFALENKVGMKVCYVNVNRWKLDDKHYGEGIIWQGYTLSFYLEFKQHEKTGLDFLAGFLRCNGLGKGHHYMPVEMQVIAITNKGKERKFSPMNIEFTIFEHAIGGQISLPTVVNHITLRSAKVVSEIEVEIPETFECFVENKSELVKDNIITMNVYLHYKPLSPEKIEELLDAEFWQLERKKIKREKNEHNEI